MKQSDLYSEIWRTYRGYINNNPVFQIIGFGVSIFDETLKMRDIQEIHDRIIVPRLDSIQPISSQRIGGV